MYQGNETVSQQTLDFSALHYFCIAQTREDKPQLPSRCKKSENILLITLVRHQRYQIYQVLLERENNTKCFSQLFNRF